MYRISIRFLVCQEMPVNLKLKAVYTIFTLLADCSMNFFAFMFLLEQLPINLCNGYTSVHLMALRLTVCREIRPIRVDFSMFISKANTSILCHSTHYYLIPFLINLTDVALELFMEFGFPSPFFLFLKKENIQTLKTLLERLLERDSGNVMSIFLIKIFFPPASLYVYIIYTYYQLFPLWWITYYHFLVTKLVDNVWGSLSSALRLKKMGIRILYEMVGD